MIYAITLDCPQDPLDNAPVQACPAISEMATIPFVSESLFFAHPKDLTSASLWSVGRNDFCLNVLTLPIEN